MSGGRRHLKAGHFLIILLCLALGGCGLFGQAEPEPLREPSGAGAEPAPSDEKLYSAAIECDSPDSELCELFEKSSRLAVMNHEGQGLAPRAALDQRLSVSLSRDGRDILHSLGYYEGEVEGAFLAGEAEGALIAGIKFTPGPRYRLGRSLIHQTEKTDETPGSEIPSDLAEAGLKPGDEARAAKVLAAVDKLPGLFQNRGYPRAAIQATRYSLLPAEKELETEVWMRPGDFARMGGIRVDSEEGEEMVVDESYLKAHRTWEKGLAWRQDLVEDYLARLRGTGLFQTVNGFAAREKDAEGLTPLRLRLTGAPPRSVGGLISYDTDFGPGLTGYWEHRNFTKRGDRLRLDLPLWADLQQFTAAYRYPFFFDPRQDFIAQGGMLHQDTEAYELFSAALSAGVERRLSPRWKASVSGAAEGGSLTDPGEEAERFFMFGLPLSLSYDSADSLMDPARGARLIMRAAPWQGVYQNGFSVFRTRLEGQAFLPVLPEKLTLAAKAVWGAVWGAGSAQELPSSLRFYSGGGGSVRGYEYQSVGPRSEDYDPLGGISQFETSLESRLRLSDSLGAVAFLDGGMVYDDPAANVLSDLLWGAGLGLRFYTPIGPVRADLAMPLDRRDNDSAWQAYISIGQSF